MESARQIMADRGGAEAGRHLAVCVAQAARAVDEQHGGGEVARLVYVPADGPRAARRWQAAWGGAHEAAARCPRSRGVALGRRGALGGWGESTGARAQGRPGGAAVHRPRRLVDERAEVAQLLLHADREAVAGPAGQTAGPFAPSRRGAAARKARGPRAGGARVTWPSTPGHGRQPTLATRSPAYPPVGWRPARGRTPRARRAQSSGAPSSRRASAPGEGHRVGRWVEVGVGVG